MTAVREAPVAALVGARIQNRIQQIRDDMKFAFVFPGQGSQSVGMLNAFADHAIVRETVQEASDALGQDLGKLIAEGPAEDLNLTTNTQPVMLTAAYAIYRAWQKAGGPAPSIVAGHSLGEYTALVAAGALAFRDAVPLVRFRAQAMQTAVPVGEGGVHAGEWETSMLMAIHPDLVHLERGEPGYTGDLQDAIAAMFGSGVRSISENGVVGDPTRASPAHGGRYWEQALRVTLEGID